MLLRVRVQLSIKAKEAVLMPRGKKYGVCMACGTQVNWWNFKVHTIRWEPVSEYKVNPQLPSTSKKSLAMENK